MRLDLSADAVEAVQDALAALHGLYATQVNFGRRDQDDHWTKKLLAVEEAATSIERQTGVALPSL
jgi:hypothetical protein